MRMRHQGGTAQQPLQCCLHLVKGQRYQAPVLLEACRGVAFDLDEFLGLRAAMRPTIRE